MLQSWQRIEPDWNGLSLGRDIAPREHGHHTRYGESLGGIDGRDSGVRVGTAQDGRVQHVRQLDVIDKRRLAGEEPHVFPTPDRRADIGLSHGMLLVADHTCFNGYLYSLSQR